MPSLSERESKDLLSAYGVPFPAESLVATAEQAVAAAEGIGYPVVLKLNGDQIAHKSERGLVRVGLGDGEAVRQAAGELLAAATPDDGEVGLLVAEMVRGDRELLIGMSRDPQFGPTVVVGLGGVLTEALSRVAVRPVSLGVDFGAGVADGAAGSATTDEGTVDSVVAELGLEPLLGAFRGAAPADRAALAQIVGGLGRLARERADVVSVDLNPVIVDRAGRPVAVDALVELAGDRTSRESTPAGPSPARAGAGSAAEVAASVSRSGQDAHVGGAPGAAGRAGPLSTDQFRALFDPRGVVVVGASTHPGKFGFVALHNLLASGYAGEVFATNRDGADVLGLTTLTDIDQVPDGRADLVVVCTPASTNVELLRAARAKGITAAFITSAGYGEAGPEGRAAEAELVAVANELGMLIAGPNGQGVVSTPAKLCAQIVAPYPPPGRIGIASQSGNFVSTFMNYARATGVGVSRAVSAGNAAQVSVADYLDFYADDDETSVALAYLEGITDGRALMERLAAVAARKPLVLLKGGATSSGARAAASHTGALATDDRVFDGFCRAAGITRAATIEEAFDAAATFATQPTPRGGNIVVLTTAGGWGVVTADAIAVEPGLDLVPLPDDLRTAIDGELPPRWSRSNPVDCAGGETRDTIPNVLGLIAEHPDVDAVVQLGVGIQGNQARLMREGPFHPDHGLGRIVEFHERQDARYGDASVDVSEATGKPILVASELAVADPANAAIEAIRRRGRLCYPTGNRAARALGHLVRDSVRRVGQAGGQ